MPVFVAIILAVVQGLTEFLPVSSSGHLAVFQHFIEVRFALPATPLAFDVLLHAATALVALWYVRCDIWMIFANIGGNQPRSGEARTLLLLVVLGTIPAAVVGLAFESIVEQSFSSITWVAKGFLITSLLLEIASRRQSLVEISDSAGLGWKLPTAKQALLIGVFQAAAVFPGISRSGSTVAAGLIQGMSAEASLRFSFLLMIPAVGGAMLLQARELLSVSSANIFPYSVGFILCLFAGFFALDLLVQAARKAKLRWFALYTLLLGAVLHLA